MYLTKYEERDAEVTIGVRPLMIPASAASIRVSPKANSVNGAVQKQRQYEEMTPRCPIVGKRRPGDQRDNDQRDGTKHESAKGYVAG